MINVLDYLLKEGKIKEGDNLGHITSRVSTARAACKARSTSPTSTT